MYAQSEQLGEPNNFFVYAQSQQLGEPNNFFVYAQSEQLGEPNNFFGSKKTNRPKEDIYNWLWLFICLRGVNILKLAMVIYMSEGCEHSIIGYGYLYA